MASVKKKLDEYHLKVLRQLVTLPANKQCFDCNQRGPTYVNVTIGSFVCTTCSGMLRGLTPPHRVKSISMATFTPEEIDFIKARGNEYCHRIWLGLCDNQLPTKDEQQIKDFMIAKYERKRYYVDPAIAATLNGNATNGSSSPLSKPSTPNFQMKTKHLPLLTTTIPNPNSLALNVAPTTQVVTNNAFPPEPSFNADFSNLENITPSDPFSSSTSTTQSSFANFDNNPAFNNSSSLADMEILSQSSTTLPQTFFQPSTSLPHMYFPFVNLPTRAVTTKINNVPTNRWSFAGVNSNSVPGEDRYAALKDLDSLMKSQQQQQVIETQPPASEWNNGVSNVWPNSVAFTQPTNHLDNNITSNPFKGENAWTNGNSVGANPFRNSRPTSEVIWPVVVNGQIPNGFPTSQSLNFEPSKIPWNGDAISNPFVIGNTQTTGNHSSNPFL
uniref:Arf-GAP domain-containing protein n=1 Tax=Clastoptera arizonana TaxID=38151 RepID=A0A1B6CQD2_9HEMI